MILWIIFEFFYFVPNLTLCLNDFRKTIHELFHFLFFVWTKTDNISDWIKWVHWDFMTTFLNTFDCFLIFLFIIVLLFILRCLLIVKLKFFIIWDSHFFLILLYFFVIAAFSFDIFQYFSTIKGQITYYSFWTLYVRKCWCCYHFWFCENHTCSIVWQMMRNFYV